MLRFLKYWLPVLLYAGLIFYVSSISLPTPPIKVPFSDKIVHVLEYAILGCLVYRACIGTPKILFFKNASSISILSSTLYGLSDEIHQFFVPGRCMDFFDFLADTIGACLAILLLNLLSKNKNPSTAHK
jgi:VanZ family protein